MATSAQPEESFSSGQRSMPVETEILQVFVEREGQTVIAKWGLHPKLKEELRPEEWKELTEIMSKVTGIVGKRFSEILAQHAANPAGEA
ncbi:MAG: hypothetical protein D6704_00065 [Nitrospirae bacterium]|nr:MAG: hypothetical protein D6704_00065 [Nitrospirota bacterium]